MGDRNLDVRPTREERLEDAPAHLAMQAAHAVDRAAAPDGEIRHVEWFIRVVRILPAEREDIVERDAQAFLGVLPQKELNESRGEAIEARRDRGVRGEDVSCSGDRQ